MHRENFERSTASRQLYLRLARTLDKLRREVEDVLKVQGLSEAQYNVLSILNGAHPGSLTCGEIAAQMVSRDPDITRLLDRLETARLIERRRGVPDRRMTSVTILPAGRSLLEALEEPMRELQERQFSHLADEETHALFYRLLQLKRPEAGSESLAPAV